MEENFQITRPIFLNISTGWFDRSKNGSNLVLAKDITVEPIQGRYRLNLNDNKLGIQEFFFDLEWSPYAEQGEEIKVISKEVVNDYFPRLKKAGKVLLSNILQYVPQRFVYVRASGSGLHIIFFLKGLTCMYEWYKITSYLINASDLPNTKNAKSLVFGLDKDTILSSDRKISEFGSWNKLKKELKKEVDYLNYAQYLTVDEFLASKDYPFCDNPDEVRYPHYEYTDLNPKLLLDANTEGHTTTQPIYHKPAPLKPCAEAVLRDLNPISASSPASILNRCPAYLSMLRKKDTEWYERHFLVKYLKYVLGLSKSEILELFSKYAGWSDYTPKATAYYVNKHFREGTCETKVQKPPRKETLIKYGLCVDNCKFDCICLRKEK